MKPNLRILAAVAIGAALIPLNSTMVAVALPEMGRSFDADVGKLTLWLVTSYLLVNVIFQSPAGRLGDVLGRRKTFFLGQMVFGLGALIAVLAPTLGLVALARILMALGGALLVPTGMALLRNVVSEEARPRAFSYFGALLGASAAIGPVVGGVLTDRFGWKATFLVNVPLLLLSRFLARGDLASWGDPSERPSTRPRFDPVGMFLLAAGLASAVIGMKVGPEVARFLVPVGFVVLIAFVGWERRVDSPLIDPGLFRKIPFVVGGTIVGLQNLAMYALLFQIPFLLREWMGLGLNEVGRVLLSMTLGMVLFSPVGGNLASGIGTRLTVLGGLSASLLGLFGLLYATSTQSLTALMISLGFVGAGIGVVTGPSQAAALSRIDPSQSGAGAGVLSTLRYVGGILGVTVVSVILTDADSAAELSQNRICFWIYAAAHLVALVLAMALPGRPKGAVQLQ